VPYGTDFFSTEFQAMNCLATFIRSLRDSAPFRLPQVSAWACNSSKVTNSKVEA
jgi:hypothetical protein